MTALAHSPGWDSPGTGRKPGSLIGGFSSSQQGKGEDNSPQIFHITQSRREKGWGEQSMRMAFVLFCFEREKVGRCIWAMLPSFLLCRVSGSRSENEAGVDMRC